MITFVHINLLAEVLLRQIKRSIYGLAQVRAESQPPELAVKLTETAKKVLRYT